MAIKYSLFSLQKLRSTLGKLKEAIQGAINRLFITSPLPSSIWSNKIDWKYEEKTQNAEIQESYKDLLAACLYCIYQTIEKPTVNQDL